MGPQLLAGAVFGVLIFFARYIVDQLNEPNQRLQKAVADILSFFLGMLAGYGVNHLIFIGFLEKQRIPLGGPGALSSLLSIVLLLSFLYLTRRAIAHKSRDFQTGVGFLAFIFAFMLIYAANYLVFVMLLGFSDIPTGGTMLPVGVFGGYLICHFVPNMFIHFLRQIIGR